MTTRQSTGTLAFISKGIDDPLEVQDAVAVERLSSLYELKARIRYESELPLAGGAAHTLLLQPASLFFIDGENVGDPWHGIISEVIDLTPRQNRIWEYRVTIVPRLWGLSRTVRSRMFHKCDVLDIARKLLVTQLGLEEGKTLELKLGRSYPPAEYTVQYEESDLAFLCRLLEHHGITFYFEQSMEAAAEKLVLTDGDSWARRPNGDLVHYARQAGFEHLHELHAHYVALPKRVELRGYDPSNPAATVRAHADVRHGRTGVVVFAGESFATHAEGQRFADMRAEVEALKTNRLFAETMARGLHAGYQFGLAGFPNPQLDGKDYVVVAATHHIQQARFTTEGDSTPYRNELELAPKAVQYRPPLVTARPRIDGTLPGIVSGGAGPAAPLDTQGRYQVVFSYDTEAQASRWVSRAQPYSGAGYGMHFPLHTGTEVAVGHLEGDPDRPLILGTVPHGSTPTPVSQANATQNVVSTHNGIVMELEDDA